MSGRGAGPLGIILDSSIIVAFERRRFDFERFLAEHAPPAIAAITAGELLIGVERADTPERRSRREAFVQSIFDRVPVIPFDMAQARLFAWHFADLAIRGEMIGDRDLQIAVTALSLDFDIASLNQGEFSRVKGLRLAEIATYMLNRRLAFSEPITISDIRSCTTSFRSTLPQPPRTVRILVACFQGLPQPGAAIAHGINYCGVSAVADIIGSAEPVSAYGVTAHVFHKERLLCFRCSSTANSATAKDRLAASF